MNLERGALIAMGAGLLCIGQPWAHTVLAAGFPLVAIGVVAYNAAAWLRGGDREDGP